VREQHSHNDTNNREKSSDKRRSIDDFGKPYSWDEICAKHDKENNNPHKLSWAEQMEMHDAQSGQAESTTRNTRRTPS